MKESHCEVVNLICNKVECSQAAVEVACNKVECSQAAVEVAVAAGEGIVLSVIVVL